MALSLTERNRLPMDHSCRRSGAASSNPGRKTDNTVVSLAKVADE